MVQNASRLQQVCLVELVKHRKTKGREMLGRTRVEEGTDLIVTGEVNHAEQSWRVIVAFAVLQPTLVRQK
jgi:hypothetical protein